MREHAVVDDGKAVVREEMYVFGRDFFQVFAEASSFWRSMPASSVSPGAPPRWVDGGHGGPGGIWRQAGIDISTPASTALRYVMLPMPLVVMRMQMQGDARFFQA